MIEKSALNRILGCLYGQAIGDALGLGSEFMSKEEVQKYYPDGLYTYDQIIQDAHRRRWAKGDWTDDTDMMLCLLHAFTDEGFDYLKAAANFKEWYKGGPMGIGRSTLKVLMLAEYTEKPFEASKLVWDISRNTSAANGALMRTSVMALWPEYNENWIIEACKLTHYDPRCIYSCIIVTAIIHSMVWMNIAPSYNDIYELASSLDKEAAECVSFAHNAQDISELELDKQPGIGYTYRALSGALWCVWHADSFVDGLLKIVNAGGDADTNGAISGAALGAKFGLDSIPQRFIENLNHRDKYDEQITGFINKIDRLITE